MAMAVALDALERGSWERIATHRATVLLAGSHGVGRALAPELSADRFRVVTAGPRAGELGDLPAPDVVVVDGREDMAGAIVLVTGIRDGAFARGVDRALPVLVLCPAEDQHAGLWALERGADDALAAPFAYPELAVRLASLLRRSRGGPFARTSIGGLDIDVLQRTATLNGRRLVLAAKEFGLLVALARDPRRVHTKAELLGRVWGYDTSIRTRTVDTHACRLRRKLAEIDAEPGLVENVWGIGYRLLPLDA